MIGNVKNRRYWKKIIFNLRRGPGMMAFANLRQFVNPAGLGGAALSDFKIVHLRGDMVSPYGSYKINDSGR